MYAVIVLPVFWCFDADFESAGSGVGRDGDGGDEVWVGEFEVGFDDGTGCGGCDVDCAGLYQKDDFQFFVFEFQCCLASTVMPVTSTSTVSISSGRISHEDGSGSQPYSGVDRHPVDISVGGEWVGGVKQSYSSDYLTLPILQNRKKRVPHTFRIQMTRYPIRPTTKRPFRYSHRSVRRGVTDALAGRRGVLSFVGVMRTCAEIQNKSGRQKARLL